MAALFAPNAYLSLASPPVITAPFTVGCWVKRTDTVNSQDFWTLCSSANTNHFWRLIWSQASTAGQFGCAAGGTTASASASGGIPVDTWVYAIARAISSANRRIDILNGDGSIVSAQNTTSLSPTVNTLSIGIQAGSSLVNPLTGSVAEFWYGNADIQSDGGALDGNLLRQLAYGGPFSVPHIIPNIIEYRSLKSSLGSDTDKLGENYFGRAGRQNYVNNSGVILGPHPPLPYWYKKPEDISRLAMV
jgi:hypothetical protein